MANRLPLAAGTLRHIISIEEPCVVGAGRANEPVTVWRLWKRAHAAVRTAPSREYMQQGAGSSGAAQTRSEQVIRFTCRYAQVKGLTYAMRVMFQGNAYNITEIRPDLEGMVETVIEARLAQ